MFHRLQSFRRSEYDLTRWRRRHRAEFISDREPCVLDLEEEAGWDLAEQLLRPRQLYSDDGAPASSAVSPTRPWVGRLNRLARVGC